MGRVFAAFAIPAAVVFATAVSSAQAATCESLITLSLPATTITIAQSVPAGTFTPPVGPPITGLPAFCRVAGVIAPTSDSAIGFEVWMPSGGWNGRYLQNGNGGFAGSISYSSLGGALIGGFATAATDDGHTGSGIDASWALGHPQKVIDFGYRAVHQTAVQSQAIVAAYYGSDAGHAYFMGCSDGGREGMMETQRYPRDFDGWVIGAPAYNWAGLVSGFIWDEQAINATPESKLPLAKLQLLSSAIVAKCDALDGVVDGVLDNPHACRFDPGVLQCTGADGPTCLTADQVTAVRKIHAGPSNPSTGRAIYPGFAKGGESDPGAWPAWITNPDGGGAQSLQFFFAFGTGAYFVFDDPAWDYRTFNFASDEKLFRSTLNPTLSALDTNLAAVAKADKKIILYHGWSDTALTPRGTIEYYKAVAARLGAETLGTTLPQVADFYRLFMAPGMDHCAGGPGPNAFGQIFGLNGLNSDPEHNVVSAIVRWVEQGVPPDRIIATKYNNDDPAQGVLRSRPLCPYPQTALYAGTGSTDDPANFTCGAAVPVASQP